MIADIFLKKDQAQIYKAVFTTSLDTTQMKEE